MPATNEKFLVAAVQAAPVFLDREATTERACELIAAAAGLGARLVVFPEAFIPAYPDWVWAIPAGETSMLNELYAELLANAVAIPGPDAHRLSKAARDAGVCVVMGLCERNTEGSGASLYNSLLYIGPDGDLLGVHRKLVPTGGERLVWAQGDGSTLAVYDTSLGKLSGLICWENYMPLARYSLYARGVQIYAAPTWDRGPAWLATLQHIAREGRVYVIGCGMALRKDDIPDRYTFKHRFYQDVGEWINTGDSAIVDPEGNLIAGPLQKAQEILVAEVDLGLQRGSRWMLDVAGHYSRPDIFELRLRQEPRRPLQFEPEEPGGKPFGPPQV
jgi:nitrilase